MADSHLAYQSEHAVFVIFVVAVLGPFLMFHMPLGGREGLEMILARMAFTCLNMSSCQAISMMWTHFVSNSIIF